MTIFVYGVGAIGGTIAAQLALSGQKVAGIARGRQLEAIRSNGLLLRRPEGATRATFACHGSPAEAGIASGDMILLTMKGQDTQSALVDLAAAGVTDQPIFCFQNGVDNERQALRMFPNVYGVTVLMPATYVEPGEVAAFGSPNTAIFDIGRYPRGSDAVVEELAAALTKAGMAAFANQDVMPSKYAKLLSNLGNIFDAALGEAGRGGAEAKAARAEANRVLEAAGITVATDRGPDDPRRKELMQMKPVEGADRVGSSSAQSLARGAGSIETDYLNGEIALLGRLHGVPAPINAYMCELARRLLREKLKPGDLPADEVKKALAPFVD